MYCDCYIFVFFFLSSIENNEGKLILTPEMGADTYVNGQVIIIINNILSITAYFSEIQSTMCFLIFVFCLLASM